MNLEKSILSYSLWDCKNLPLVLEKIDDTCFDDVENQNCFRGILNNYQQDKKVTKFSVNEYLKKNKIPQLTDLYFDDLLNYVDTDNYNWDMHCDILASKGTKNKLNFLILSAKSQLDSNPNEDEVLNELVQNLSDLQNDIYDTEEKSIIDISTELTKRIELAQQGKLKSYKLGIPNLDKKYGFDTGQLIVLAARPGMGKTSLLISSLVYNSITGMKPFIISIEMTSTELLLRLLSREMRLPMQDIKDGRIDWEHYNKCLAKIQDLEVEISDGIRDLNAIKAQIIKQANKGSKIVYIDYLGQITTKYTGNRKDLEIATITGDLKFLAKKLDISIVLLSQLSRKVEERPDKRPYCSDLRDSGAIEQDADSILFIYRPEFYNIEEDEAGESTIDKAEIIIGKNRHGATGIVKTDFIKRFAMFTNSTDKPIEYEEPKQLEPNGEFESEVPF